MKKSYHTKVVFPSKNILHTYVKHHEKGKKIVYQVSKYSATGCSISKVDFLSIDCIHISTDKSGSKELRFDNLTELF